MDAAKACRDALLARMDAALVAYSPNSPLVHSAQEIVHDYSTETLEALVPILEACDDFDCLEVVERITMPRYEHLMLPAAVLQKQLNALDFLPESHVGFKQSMLHYESLRCYASDSRVPEIPEPGQEFHPIHLAIIIVTETAYTMTEITSFNAIEAEIIGWLKSTSYQLIDEELFAHVTSHPEDGVRIARLGFLLETMHLSDLLPYMELIERYPDGEDRVTGLLASGTVRRVQIEAVLNGQVSTSISEGAL